MTSISLNRSDSSSVGGVFCMVLSVDSAVGITTNLFIKQRTLNLDGSFNDNFVAIADVIDIEDYMVGAPGEGDTYFLDNTISLVSSDLDKLNDLFGDITALLAKTCRQADDLANIASSSNYAISANQP